MQAFLISASTHACANPLTILKGQQEFCLSKPFGCYSKA
nr:MAG TPA: protein of unknown function DUF3818 [Caudoviricetes sp.]